MPPPGCARCGSGSSTWARTPCACSSRRLLPAAAIEAARRAAKRQAETGRLLGCSDVRIVVTSPGRQAANADELLSALDRIRDELDWSPTVALEDGLDRYFDWLRGELAREGSL